MEDQAVVEEVAPGAFFLVDSRQFESAIYTYDERISTSFLCYGTGQQEPHESENDDLTEETSFPDVTP